jgi:hypothetical protein
MTKVDAVDRHFVGFEFQHRRGFTICHLFTAFYIKKNYDSIIIYSI